jgi:hypothetical protein
VKPRTAGCATIVPPSFRTRRFTAAVWFPEAAEAHAHSRKSSFIVTAPNIGLCPRPDISPHVLDCVACDELAAIQSVKCAAQDEGAVSARVVAYVEGHPSVA